MTTFLPVLLVVESGDCGGCIRTHAAIGVTWPHTLEKRQRERAAAGGWKTRLRLKEATVTSEIRRWRLQSASKHGVNKAQVRAECKQWEDEGEQEDELWEFVLHLLGRVSLQRQRPSLHSPLISPSRFKLAVQWQWQWCSVKMWLFFFFSLFHTPSLSCVRSATHNRTNTAEQNKLDNTHPPPPPNSKRMWRVRCVSSSACVCASTCPLWVIIIFTVVQGLLKDQRGHFCLSPLRLANWICLLSGEWAAGPQSGMSDGGAQCVFPLQPRLCVELGWAQGKVALNATEKWKCQAPSRAGVRLVIQRAAARDAHTPQRILRGL